ncbi:MAG: SDR family NAD(P)-dependent oxidoreductase [Parvibaculaceae bacterium]
MAQTRDGETQTILVTGASSGIGEAFAHLLAREGHRLVLVARREGEIHRVSGVINAQTGQSPLAIALDLGDHGAAGQLEEELEGRGIEPDVIVNNAGYGLFGPAGELSREDQLGIVDLNVRTLVDLSLRYLPAMRRKGSGGLLNVCSVAGFLPGPYMATYFASKAFILSWSEALATEYRGTGVTVTALCPGPVPTGFQARAGMNASKVYRGIPQVTSMDCAVAGWRAFRRGQRLAFPDLSSGLSAYASRYIPNRILLPIVRLIQAPKRNT